MFLSSRPSSAEWPKNQQPDLDCVKMSAPHSEQQQPLELPAVQMLSEEPGAMNNELRSAAGAHRRPALAAVEGRRAPPPHTGIAHINPNTRLPTAVEATAVEAAAVKAEQSGLFFPAELNDRPCRLTSLALFVLCLIVSASSILGATCTKLCNPTHSSSSRKTVRSWTPTRRFVAVVLLALVNAPLALSEFTVKDIAQQTPMAGAPNSITVSLQVGSALLCYSLCDVLS
eukprot:3505503-Rhodomonas_salina.1